ncbi:MAG: hypothetical protein ACOX2K_11180 [Bacillota bacterium]
MHRKRLSKLLFIDELTVINKLMAAQSNHQLIRGKGRLLLHAHLGRVNIR